MKKKFKRETKPQNPQEWLPVGQYVQLDNTLHRPHTWNARGKKVFFAIGKIEQHLAQGGMSLRFDGYPNQVDYTAQEARRFAAIF